MYWRGGEGAVVTVLLASYSDARCLAHLSQSVIIITPCPQSLPSIDGNGSNSHIPWSIDVKWLFWVLQLINMFLNWILPGICLNFFCFNLLAIIHPVSAERPTKDSAIKIYGKLDGSCRIRFGGVVGRQLALLFGFGLMSWKVKKSSQVFYCLRFAMGMSEEGEYLKNTTVGRRGRRRRKSLSSDIPYRHLLLSCISLQRAHENNER